MQISEAEFVVMKVVWKSDRPLGSREIISALEETEDWKPKTVQTLISRLVQKDALGFSAEGRNYLYHAKVSENDCLEELSHFFLERFFGGALRPMLSHFAGSKRLSAEEAALLRKLLEKGRE